MKKKPVEVLDLEMLDTTNAPLQVRYVGHRTTTASGGTLTIDNNGDDNTKLLITAVGWDDTASPPAAATKYYAASAYAAGGSDATVCTTLQALIDAMNGDNIGFDVRRAHGMSDLTTDSDNFMDISATQFGGDWTNFLFRNASEYATGWSARAAIPELNKKGRIELIQLKGTGTYASGALTWNVSTDAGSAAADEVQLFSVAGGATTVEGTVFDYADQDDKLVVHGPVAIECVGTALSAATAKLLYRPES